VLSENVSTYKNYSIHITSEIFGMCRDTLAYALSSEGIETKKYFYPPLHKQKLYAAFYGPEHTRLDHTDFITEGILSLPMYESLPEPTVEGIAYAVQRIWQFKAAQQQGLAKENRHYVAAHS
jgi:dTDP-4-amino-4,6-dideoxygalactose transaminase